VSLCASLCLCLSLSHTQSLGRALFLLHSSRSQSFAFRYGLFAVLNFLFIILLFTLFFIPYTLYAHKVSAYSVSLTQTHTQTVQMLYSFQFNQFITPPNISSSSLFSIQINALNVLPLFLLFAHLFGRRQTTTIHFPPLSISAELLQLFPKWTLLCPKLSPINCRQILAQPPFPWNIAPKLILC